MLVMVSSKIGGFEAYRRASRTAIESLGMKPWMAEDLRASNDSPRRACLEGVRKSDVVALVLGAEYGDLLPSGKSATHEEFEEACENSELLVFVQSGVTRDARQARLVKLAQNWTGGTFTADFSSPDELQREMIAALHQHEMKQLQSPVDPEELLGRARNFLPRHGRDHVSTPSVGVAVACGPHGQLIRPRELTGSKLQEAIHQAAKFGEHAVLSRTAETEVQVENDTIVMRQRHAELRVNETGEIFVRQPVTNASAPHYDGSAIFEDIATAAVARALRFAAQVIDVIDGSHCISSVAPVATLYTPGVVTWGGEIGRNAAGFPMGTQRIYMGEFKAIAPLKPPHRPLSALRHKADDFADDFVAVLKRQLK